MILLPPELREKLMTYGAETQPAPLDIPGHKVRDKTCR